MNWWGGFQERELVKDDQMPANHGGIYFLSYSTFTQAFTGNFVLFKIAVGFYSYL